MCYASQPLRASSSIHARPARHCSPPLLPAHSPAGHAHFTVSKRQRYACIPQATNQDEGQKVQSTKQQPDRNSQQEPPTSPLWVQQLQRKWDSLDTPQKGYTIIVALVILGVLPRILTLLVLGLERILIGGLLAVEEALLELLFRGGALVGAVGAVGLVVAGIYLFFLAPKTTK